MEAIEERPVLNSTIESVKPNLLEENTVLAVESSVCHKSNGVDDDKNNDNIIEVKNSTSESSKEEINDKVVDHILASTDNKAEDSLRSNTPPSEVVVTNQGNNGSETQNIVDNVVSYAEEVQATTIINEVVTEVTIDEIESEDPTVVCEEVVTETIVDESNTDSTMKDVKFETEVLVEESENDIENLQEDNCEKDTTHHILSELDHNIELSEVLQSSDITEESNDNSSEIVRQEVFNKEELLDILEGNDAGEPEKTSLTKLDKTKMLEAQIALKQLSRLQNTRKKYSIPRAKKGEKKSNSVKKMVDDNNIDKRDKTEELSPQSNKASDKQKATVVDKQPETKNIVNALVMDWDDDELNDTNQSDKVEDSKDNAEVIKEEHEKESQPEELLNQTSLDSNASEDLTQHTNKNDDSAPRRVSRVIKKKVIFDPDNPDTFTKGKTPSKNKEITEQHSIKKTKSTDETQPRSKSKSPMSKLQWKKPIPKNNKQNKRLSEVDKLLMDEGAVNMIYQLTPEAPKGKKNMKTKAEFIKKLQSSTPEGKEMKFRERKKELLKYEDGEAKKILGVKHRISLSSSVKSPSVSEDFETHSADDSIIYRRHSSSSYSSSCMSPRRLSDVETSSIQNVNQVNQKEKDPDTSKTKPDSFMNNSNMVHGNEIINKNDCLSIKEKLNSKLSLALNKRKRDSSKPEKPIKQKKLSKDSNEGEEAQFKYVSLVVEQSLAIVSIKKTGVKVELDVVKELEEALIFLDTVKEISVTMLSSQCGVLCSSLNLNLLIEENKETRIKQAYALADSIRSLLNTIAQHSKLLCCSVWGACSGVSLALVTLSDVVLASECATFALSIGPSHLFPGIVALTARCRALPQAMINDLVIFGRRISSSEALQGGLISRTLWPDNFEEQVLNIVRDIAAQPAHTLLLKKKLLHLSNNIDEQTFLSCLETERDLLVQYWTSAEGQNLLRATNDAL